MKLKDCILDINRAVTAPLMKKEPEPDWTTARDMGILPEAGFRLYSRSGYLSFGHAPLFLADESHLLFSYFALLLRSILDELVEADIELHAFAENRARAYDVGKRLRGEDWDPGADKEARRHFRRLLLSLHSSLDALADLIALFLTGLIPGLRLGRAKFSDVETWLKRPLPPPASLIVTPRQEFLERMHAGLSTLVYPEGPEEDWLPLMRMLRNKSAHLGDAVFRLIALHDKEGRFYSFLPRQWPFLFEEHMRFADERPEHSSEPFPDLFRRVLVHQDIISYTEGLRRKITQVLSSGLEILDDAYFQFRNLPCNTAALAELQGNTQSYTFKHFSE